ncbi:MAG: hypothetical protein IK103_03980 [Bacteroidales bacterium]|nr:hypothetical protein [Bacteroidales bacterium]
MLQYQFFPRSIGVNDTLNMVIECFSKHISEIESPDNKLKSNDVLKILEPDLKSIGFIVEESKKSSDKIKVPVLFGKNNNIEKFFDADGVSEDGRIVLEVEAGRALANNQFLKDIFQACMMYSVEYLIIAVRNEYNDSKDFERIYDFLETLYINSRLKLPLKGILLIGY